MTTPWLNTAGPKAGLRGCGGAVQNNRNVSSQGSEGRKSKLELLAVPVSPWHSSPCSCVVQALCPHVVLPVSRLLCWYFPLTSTPVTLN